MMCGPVTQASPCPQQVGRPAAQVSGMNYFAAWMAYKCVCDAIYRTPLATIGVV